MGGCKSTDYRQLRPNAEYRRCGANHKSAAQLSDYSADLRSPIGWRIDAVFWILDRFNEDHRRVIEVVARQISHTLKRAAEFDNTTRLDSITGLPNLHQLEQLLQSTGSDSLSVASELTLVFIDVVSLKDINTQHGRQAGEMMFCDMWCDTQELR